MSLSLFLADPFLITYTFRFRKFTKRIWTKITQKNNKITLNKNSTLLLPLNNEPKMKT